MREFHRDSTIDRLSKLPLPGRIAFAASCAQRLFAAYVAYCDEYDVGDLDEMESVLDTVWNWARGANPSQVGELIERCRHLGPTDEEEDEVLPSETTSFGEEAVYSCLAAIGSAHGDPAQAAMAGEWAFNAIWAYANAHISTEDSVSSETIRRAESHGLVQAELERQQQDLVALESASPGGKLDQVIVRMERAAKVNATLFFGPDWETVDDS
jgi:Protein of unknown function (DUF416)